MARRDLEVTILRKGRREDQFAVSADPRNPADLRDILHAWLEGNRWDRGRWGEFTMDVCEDDNGPAVRTSVRAA